MQQFLAGRAVRTSVAGVALALAGWAGLAQAQEQWTPKLEAAQPVLGVTRSEAGIAVRNAGGTLKIEPWSERIVHVRFHPDAGWPGGFNPSVIAKPGKTDWKLAETEKAYVLSTSALKVRIDKATGKLAFLDLADKVLVEDAGAHPRTVSANATGPVAQAFSHGDDEFIYGLGQHLNGAFDHRGLSVLLQQANRDVGLPVLVSSRGYGILWNNAAVTRVDVGLPQTPHEQVIRSEAGGGVDYHFILGPELDDVVRGYRRLTGDAPMMARWTWGYWQSKEHYKTQAEMEEVVRRYRAAQVPIDAIVQDWQYWTPGTWGSHAYDPKRWPDPAGMLKTFHAANVHSIISVWARFDLGLAHTAELEKAGALYPKVYKNVYPAGQGRWYDPYSEAGRAIYWRQIRDKIGPLNFDGFWLDASEVELGGNWGEMRDVKTAMGPGAVVYNAYPLLHTKGVYEGMRRDMPNKRAFILTRSAYPGQQRHAAITWSGDTAGNWDVFRRHLPAALNFTLSGIPYWSADIGGFFGGKPSDPAYAELFTRWFQFGVFNPMFRVHGTGESKEFWKFDQRTQSVLIDYTKLRYRLLPYIYSVSWDVTSKSDSMMRPLAMDFRSDRAALPIADQYLFGKALMVAPVTQPSAAVRTVYLPGKEAWYDFWTGQRHEGGQVIAAKADIGTIPVFARAGSILPLGPVKQYADQPSNEPIELRIYPGRDGSFTLYDDEGDGYGYEQGRYATVKLDWNEAGKRLSLGERSGKYPGMAAGQAFRVVCASSPAQSRAVNYSGKVLTVDLPECGVR